MAAQAATGSGLGPGAINYVLGITKAYTTRVGEGPFPTELKDETGRLHRRARREFGTVTGRPRRCGWFDACLVRQTRKVGGINGIALTKLDVLDELAGAQDLRRLQARRPRDRLSAGGARSAGARRADLRDDGGLDGIDRAARAPGPSCRPNASNMCGGSRS